MSTTQQQLLQNLSALLEANQHASQQTSQPANEQANAGLQFQIPIQLRQPIPIQTQGTDLANMLNILDNLDVGMGKAAFNPQNASIVSLGNVLNLNNNNNNYGNNCNKILSHAISNGIPIQIPTFSQISANSNNIQNINNSNNLNNINNINNINYLNNLNNIINANAINSNAINSTSMNQWNLPILYSQNNVTPNVSIHNNSQIFLNTNNNNLNKCMFFINIYVKLH